MMRLPFFEYHAPRTVEETATILAGAGPGAMLLAGGTDLLPNMKRRHQVPATLIGLRSVNELKKIENTRGLTLGAGLTLTEVVREPRVRDAYTGLWQAAVQVATPHLRNTGTLGGIPPAVGSVPVEPVGEAERSLKPGKPQMVPRLVPKQSPAAPD